MGFIKVDENKELFLGHQFDNGEFRAVEKRCDYCGKWFTFDVKDITKWGNNIKTAFNGLKEKVHCDSEHCKDYHNRYLVHMIKMQKELDAQVDRNGMKMFKDLKRKGVI
jgi:hypothetical protein